MLSKLLSLLVAGKGGAVAAAAIVAGTATVGVMTSSTEVQDTVRDAVTAVSGVVSPGLSQLAKAGGVHQDGDCGQPEVVAQRNAADKLLRATFQEEHKRLVQARHGNDADLVTAERDLRLRLTTALNDVAKETLGREGQIKFSEPPPTSTSGVTAETPCTPNDQENDKDTDKNKEGAERGRVAVAERVTLNATLQGIVDKAKADMTAIVDAALGSLASPATTEHGKSSERGKSSEQGGGSTERGKSGDHKPTPPSRP